MKTNFLLIGAILALSFSSLVSCNENSCDCEKVVTSKILTLNSPESIIDMAITSRFPDTLSLDTSSGVSLYYWTYQGVPHQSKICMRFDLSNIPNSAKIKKATILGTEISSAYNPSDATYMYKITQDWDPSVTNWNNPPTYSKTEYIYDAKDPDDTNLKVEFDITQFVQYWTNNPTKNYGLVLELAEQNLYHGYNFYSSNELDPENRLKVIIEYEE